MKEELGFMMKVLVGLVMAYLLFCLGGAVWDAMTIPVPVNGMVGHAPGVPTLAGLWFLMALMPEIGWMFVLAVFAVLLLVVMVGDALFSLLVRGRR